MKHKIGILNLGCPRNIVDAENILGRLSLKGYQITEIAKADIAIINTCAFIDEAKKESVDAILDLIELKKEGRLKKVIVAGCLVQRYKDKLSKELSEVDAFLGKISLNHSSNRFAITPNHYAYLKICEGCVNNCSYCVIPKIKGKFKSLPIESVLDRVSSLNKKKISELNIIGQDISGYGIDLYGKRNLPELLKKIIKTAKDINWIRLLYLYPDLIVHDLIELIKDNPKICRYIDLPVQHINDRVLKLMNRQRMKKDILQLINKLRKNIPDIVLRTSVIVGFPSETEQEFKELLEFIEEAQFERLGAFIYSREEGTPAYNFKPQINHKVKVERFNAVMSAQQKISSRINEKFLGKTIEILIEEKNKDYYLGRSQYDAPEVDGVVYVKTQRKLSRGEFVQAKIIDTLEYDLVGEA
ncbi:MAG: 30S ribosomal protein S12 methylthiotransferase RimO [Candidatus Omnitrophota bacterium]